MKESIRIPETQVFDPVVFRQVERVAPELSRQQIITADIDTKNKKIVLSLDRLVRETDKKILYKPTPVPESGFLKGVWFVSMQDGVILVVGEKGISQVSKDLAEDLLAGLGQVFAQSGPNAYDAIFAKTKKTTESLVQNLSSGEWVNLSKYGFTQVAWNVVLCGYLGLRELDRHIYFLSLASAQKGCWDLEHWLPSDQDFDAPVIRIPYRIGQKNIGAVPIRLSDGITEYVDLTDFASGRIRKPVKAPSKATPPFIVVGDDEDGAVFAELRGVEVMILAVPGVNFCKAHDEFWFLTSL